jgi:hypothetical protein
VDTKVVVILSLLLERRQHHTGVDLVSYNVLNASQRVQARLAPQRCSTPIAHYVMERGREIRQEAKTAREHLLDSTRQER